MLLALLVVGALRWMSLLDPAEPFRAWEALGVAVVGGAALVAAARLAGPLRQIAAGLVLVAMLALCLLAGGLADEYLRPDHWGRLAAGIGRGLEALPGINVPYQGQDEWTRLSLAAGGTALVAGATALALWPRRDGRMGYPLPALVLLVALAVVPAVVLAFEGEFVLGAVLSLLVLGFLRLEKLRRRDAPAAGALALVAAFLALVLAPALDGRQPWWDYETWALSASTTRTTSFTWDHDYSPLKWPRDGRELIRVQARQPAYWKAQDLDAFAGGSWLTASLGRPSRDLELPPDAGVLARWTQDIRVTIRNLRTPTFIAAGVVSDVSDLPENTDASPSGTGVFESTRSLTRGDSYRATVYTPRPTDRQLRLEGTGGETWLADYRRVFVNADAPDASFLRPDTVIDFPSWIEGDAPPTARPVRPGAAESTGDATELLDQVGLGRIQRLAQRLRAGAETPFEYVERVERHLEDGFTYSETPPRAARTLDGFLFDAKVGFCQQYSGAMALLLRMGGVPARVAAGFTTGALDRTENEYVVRDLDAHSWVEVWFPSFGWVTRDPTPSAAPPRSQPGDANAGAGAPAPNIPDPGADRTTDSSPAALGPDEDGTPVEWIVAAAVLAALAVIAVPLERRRRRRLPPPALRPMAELERALRRARYDGGPGMTLAGLERSFAGWPGAAGYVRALREQRYSVRSAVPTPSQRRSLRAALARDAGRLRAWWALPPRAPTPRREPREVEIVRRARA
jgi:transglutaminase-like putative cysteine protease